MLAFDRPQLGGLQLIDGARGRRITALTGALIIALAVFGCDDGGTPSTTADEGTDGTGGAGGDGGDVDPEDMAVDVPDVPDATPPDTGVPCEPECEGGACVAGECVDVDPCEGDDDCVGDSRICNADGACEQGCESDDACEDLDAPTCYAGHCGNCEASEDCGAGECVDHMCVNPEICATSVDCTSGFECVDTRCEPIFDCRAEGATCPDEQPICDEGSGQCGIYRAGDACRDFPEACPVGRVCLVDAPRTCDYCVSDEDCPGSLSCRAGDDGHNECFESGGGCENDDDCVGARVCSEGVCEAPACEDDAFEPNDRSDQTPELVAGMVQRDLVSCNEDWFRFELPADTVALVQLRQADAGVDLDLVVYDDQDREIARSATEDLVEAVNIGPFNQDRRIRLQVVQSGEASSGDYAISIDLREVEAGECVPDPAESGAGDDSVATGRLVREEGQPQFDEGTTGSACPGDEDYICFYLERREVFTAQVEVTTGNATVNARIVDDEGELADESLQAECTRAGCEPLNWPRAARGLHCLVLSAEAGNSQYRVSFSAVPQGVQAICGDAELIGIDESAGEAEGRLSVDEDDDAMSPLCSVERANAVSDAYTVNLPGDTLLIARVIGTAEGVLGDPVISVRSDCLLAGAEMGCGTGSVRVDNPLFVDPNPAEVRVPVREGGAYTILVDGVVQPEHERGAQSYRLEVRTPGLRGRPRNDTCGDARALEIIDGFGFSAVELGDATDTLDGCFGPGGPEAVFTLELESPAFVNVTVDTLGEAFGVGAYLLEDCDAAGPIACGYGLDQLLPAGTHYLVVEGVGPNGRGRASVSVTVEDFGGGPSNDTCEGAEELAPAGETQGSTRGAADDIALADGNACTSHNTRGGEVVYSLPVEADILMFVQATPVDGWDLSLLVVDDCDSPALSCVEGSDGALTESVLFQTDQAGSVSVIVDGTNGEAGDFELRWGVAECSNDRDCPDGACVNFACE